MILGDYKIITIKTGRLSQNCYLIRHNLSEDLLLIDPGDDANHILEIIEREGSRLKFILLTHTFSIYTASHT
jgi:glyoxylase-like metal-dependent hydrolase (beta-lactamase superfamily II)